MRGLWLSLLIAPAIAGLALCANAGAAAPCTTPTCTTVTVTPIPPPSHAPPKVWAGITPGGAIKEYVALAEGYLRGGLEIKAVQAQCNFVARPGMRIRGRAWKLTSPDFPQAVYLVDSHGTFYQVFNAGTPGGSVTGCNP
jgi:hypothetical protein